MDLMRNVAADIDQDALGGLSDGLGEGHITLHLWGGLADLDAMFL